MCGLLLQESIKVYLVTFFPWIPISCTLVAVSSIPTENPAAAVDKISSHSVRHMGITAKKIAFRNRKHRSSKLRFISYLGKKRQKELMKTTVVRCLFLSRDYTCDFLLAQVLRFFKKLSHRLRTVKIARVATHEHATRQLKKSQKKVVRTEYLVTLSLV